MGWADERLAAEARRADAARAEAARGGRRVTANVAVDARVSGTPYATDEAEGAPAIDAFDGDPTTAWRGAGDGPEWELTLPFRRVVHLGFVRALFGDDAATGVPAEYRWEIQPPVRGRCETWGLWHVAERRHDRDGNEFLYGPKDVHARRQSVFFDRPACGLRLVVSVMEGSRPVVHEIEVRESAESLLAGTGVVVDAPPSSTAPTWLAAGDAVVDRLYETAWAGPTGPGVRLVVTLPEARWVDRLSLVLGEDAVTRPRRDAPGRTFGVAKRPARYRVLTTGDDDLAALVPIDEAADPNVAGLRRRLVSFAPRPVKRLVLDIPAATDDQGTVVEGGLAVVRGIGLYAADDRRPVIAEPWLLSVDANPSAQTHEKKGGESAVDGLFARDAAHRLSRLLVGFDHESRWPAEPKRPRDASTGRFLEVIEGDDPGLTRALVRGAGAPPVLLLSGSLDWEFDDQTRRSTEKPGHYRWDVRELPTSPDRGMGHLAALAQLREAPFIGFCGGAQILALFEARDAPLDAVLLRNDNGPIRGVIRKKDGVFERAWWSDLEASDASRPTFVGAFGDPLFDFGTGRRASRQMPSSHGDMIRASAFASLLRGFALSATTELCEAYVRPDGLEPTRRDADGRACVTVPQAFRSRLAGFPLVGFQFHPEQRDLARLAPGMPRDAKGDALNVMANALDLVWQSYLDEVWPFQ